MFRSRLTTSFSWIGLIVTTLTVSSAYAFDGNRKGFVAGIGLGMAPVAQWSAVRLNLEPTEVGLGANSFIGYAWNSHNSIVYSGNGCIFKSSDVNDTYFIQGLDAVSWYHFFGRDKRSLFSAVSVGRFLLRSEYDNLDGSGFGYGAAMGYEISKWFQIGLYYIGGETSNSAGVSVDHSVINILLTFNKY